MNKLITALKSVVADNDLDEELTDALYGWVEQAGNSEGLEIFIKNNPDYMATVDKGMEYQPLYRAILIYPKVLLDIINKGSNEDYRALPSPFESWTTDHSIADEFFAYEKPENYDRCFITLKKSVPEKERVVCIPCMGSDHRWVRSEKEVITTILTKTTKDIDKIRIRLPYKGQDGKLKDDGWQTISLEDATYWAENYDALFEEAQDKGMIFSWKPKGVR